MITEVQKNPMSLKQRTQTKTEMKVEKSPKFGQAHCICLQSSLEKAAKWENRVTKIRCKVEPMKHLLFIVGERKNYIDNKAKSNKKSTEMLKNNKLKVEADMVS